jgi:hypothetical protein
VTSEVVEPSNTTTTTTAAVIGIDLLTAPLRPPVRDQRLAEHIGAQDEVERFDPASLLAAKEAATKVIGGRVRDASLLDITVRPIAGEKAPDHNGNFGMADNPVVAVLASIQDDLGLADADVQVIGWGVRAPNDDGAALLAGAGPLSGQGVVSQVGDLTLALCLGWREVPTWA